MTLPLPPERLRRNRLHTDLLKLPNAQLHRRTRSLPRLAAVLAAGFLLFAANQRVSAQAPDAPDGPAKLISPADHGTAVDQPAQTVNSQTATTQAQPSSMNNGQQGGQQTKRILGIVPNFRSVSAYQTLPPQSVKEKFMTATQDSFDYSSVFVPAVLAGYSMAKDSYPEFGHGASGYGQYFWHSALDQTSENYMVEFVFPAMLHQDNRYYTLGHGGFVKRTIYSFSRCVITRSDSAREVFNASEVLGSGASAGLSNLYYPARNRTVGDTLSQWGLDVAIDGAGLWVREFWPDIDRKLFHGAF